MRNGGWVLLAEHRQVKFKPMVHVFLEKGGKIMASSMGKPVAVVIQIHCACGNTIPLDVENKEHKSIQCCNCGNNIDISCHYHTYFHGCDKHDQLVQLGVAEATRKCKVNCLKCQKKEEKNCQNT